MKLFGKKSKPVRAFLYFILIGTPILLLLYVDNDRYNGGGSYIGAIPSAKQYIQREPNNPFAHDTLGLAYYGDQKYKEAVSEHRKAVWLSPNEPMSHYYLAQALYAAGETKEAQEECQTTIRLDSKYSFPSQYAQELLKKLQ